MSHQTITLYGQQWTDVEVEGYSPGQVSFVGTDSDGLPWAMLVSTTDVKIGTTEESDR